MRLRSILPTLVLVGTIAAPAAGQDRDSLGPLRPGLLQGASFERFQDLNALFFAYRATAYRAHGPGIDLAAGILPQGLPQGVILVTLDAGLAQGIRAGPMLLLLRAGGSGFVTAGWEARTIVPGLQAGLALVVPVDRRGGVRVDLSRHLYFDENGGTTQLWSAGLGFAVR